MSNHNQSKAPQRHPTHRGATLETGETVETTLPLTRLGAPIIGGIIHHRPQNPRLPFGAAEFNRSGRHS